MNLSGEEKRSADEARNRTRDAVRERIVDALERSRDIAAQARRETGSYSVFADAIRFQVFARHSAQDVLAAVNEFYSYSFRRIHSRFDDFVNKEAVLQMRDMVTRFELMKMEFEKFELGQAKHLEVRLKRFVRLALISRSFGWALLFNLSAAAHSLFKT